MKIQVITQCTGKKAVSCPNQLTLEDFRKGFAHVSAREAQLREFVLPAEEMYTGEQHVRLMKGVKAARQSGITVETWIVSAGYGLVPGNARIAPYEATFNDLSKKEGRDWAKTLSISSNVKDVLSEPADLAIVLLGERYLDVCDLASVTDLGARTFGVCGTASVAQFSPRFHLIRHEQSWTSKMRVGMVGLKGEIARRILEASRKGSTAMHQAILDVVAC